jgi:DNA polymerase IV
MDAIHRKYSRESLKPASGVAGPEQKAEEKAGQKAK